MREEIHRKVWLEAVEEFIVIIRGHGGVETVQHGVLQVALGIPSGLDGLAPSNAAAQVWVRVESEPRSEVMEPSASFNAVDSRIHSQETVLKWL